MRVIVTGILICVLFWLGCGREDLEVEVTYPTDGSVVSGIVGITAEAIDDAVMTRVEFYIDDSLESTAFSSPFVYYWNTYTVSDSSLHEISVKGYDRDVSDDFSDTITVLVNNEPIIFADNFELYLAEEYPFFSGWYEIWPGSGSESTYVESGIAHNGDKSFRLSGLAEWVRTDGVELGLADVNQLTYEYAVMIPSGSSTGSLVGFFVQVNPNLGEVYNGVLFNYEDNLIYVRGIVPESTGYSWTQDTWYSVKVVLDYDNLLMDVWLGNDQIASDIQAATLETSNIFAVATVYGADGVVYYDDIKIYKDK